MIIIVYQLPNYLQLCTQTLLRLIIQSLDKLIKGQIQQMIQAKSILDNNSHAGYNRKCPNIEANSEVQNYKQLYFETLQKLHKLTEIQKTLNSTQLMIVQMETNQEVIHQKRTIMQLQEQLAVVSQQKESLSQQLKRANSLNEEKQSHLTKKLQTQIKRNLLGSEELGLLKNEIRILSKELQNEKQLKSQQQTKINQLEEGKTQKEGKHQYQQSQSSNNELKEIVQRQHRQITIYKRQLSDKHKEVLLCEQKITRLEQQLTQLQQLHQLQLNSKQSIVLRLTKQINKKSTIISQLQAQLHSLNINTTTTNNIKPKNSMPIAHSESRSQLQFKDKTIKRLQSQLHQYESIVSTYQIKQKQLYDQIITKDKIIEELQHQSNQHSQQVLQLQQTLSGFKNDFIHSQLVKQERAQNTSNTPKHSQSTLNISAIHNRTETALKNSRFSANPKNKLSLSRLNCSGSTVSSLPFTPINSLKNSGRVDTRNSSSRQENRQLKIGSKTGSTTSNQSSFYKKKMLQPRSNRQVTPFLEP